MHGFTIECWRELPLSKPPCSFPSEVLSVTGLSFPIRVLHYLYSRGKANALGKQMIYGGER